MTKQFFLLLFLLAGKASNAQFTVTINWYGGGANNAADTIYYDADQKLQWPDFKGRSDYNSIAAAVTESGFGYKMAMRSKDGATNLVITVYCYFNKRSSWVKKGMDTDYALTHEQHHFDITYINTYSFVQKLKAAKFTWSNYAGLVDSIYDECYASLRKMQDDYDGQTSNGRIRKIQADWNAKIDSMLARLIIN